MSSYKNAVRASITIVILAILSVGLYFLFNMSQPTLDDVKTGEYQIIEKDSPPTPNKANTLITSECKTIAKKIICVDSLNLTLLAVTVANPISLSSAVLKSKDSVETYSLNETVFQTNATIAAIYRNYIVLVMDNLEYELRLSTAAARIIDHTANQQPDSLQKADEESRAKEIGNRPKELEHIIDIERASNGYYVSPGINPALFRAARFQEGDVLQTINGKDVNISEELTQAKAMIATAETLAFTVLRGGVLITLYLDIPAESLSITH